MDLLPRGVALGEVDAAAVAAGGTGPLFVEGLSRMEVGLPPPPWRGPGGWVDTILGRGGAVPGGRRGSGVERLVGGAGIPCAGAVGDCGPVG